MYKDMNISTDNTSASAYVDLTPIEGLSLRAQYSLSNENVLSQNFHSKNTIYGSSYNGVAKIANARDTYHQAEGVATYHKNFKNTHDLKITAGVSYLSYSAETSSMNAHDFSTESMSYYNIGAAAAIDNIASSRQDKVNLSYFARAEYVLKDKYI